MKLVEFQSQEDFVQASIDFFMECFRMRSGVFRVALSGGSTPIPVYKSLADSALDWSRTELYQVDERYVPHSDSRSNFRLIDEAIVSKVGSRLGGFFAFETKLSIDDSVDAYEHILSKKIIHGFDLCVLGIGSDGHTASLFPHSPALAEKNRPVVHTQTERFEIKDRLTLTFPVLMRSKKILVLLKGADKLAVIDTLQAGKKTVDEFPAMKLLEHSDITFYYLS